MPVTVRPMTGTDELADLNAGNPMGWQAEWWVELDAGEQKFLSWFVGEVDDEPVGFAAACPLPFAQGGNGVGIVHVLAGGRRRGVGTALLAEVDRVVRAGGMPGVQLSWVEGDQDGGAAAAAWGLREVARHRESVLDLTRLDDEAYAARSAVPGVDLTPLPAFDQLGDEDWHALHDFASARFAEAPDAAAGGEGPGYDMFRSMVTEPWSMVTAREDGELLGFTAVTRRPGTSDVVNTFFTGVAPAGRGRGVATALKCRHALLLAAAGMTRLYTQNMDGNEPILAANRTLGFVPAGGYVDVVREFSG